MKTDSGNVINVIIADDHVLYRRAVIAALSFKKDIKIIAEADNGSHLLNLLETMQPDVILLDIQMPVMDGIATLPEVKKLYPGIRVIMLTMVNDQRMITKLTELGANSYLIKTSDSEIIYEAIKTCHEKGFYFHSLPDETQFDNLQKKTPSFTESQQKDIILSEKEIIVLRLICEEKSSSEIAAAVKLSPAIIKAITHKLMIKTGTKSVAGLIMFALKNNLPGKEI